MNRSITFDLIQSHPAFNAVFTLSQASVVRSLNVWNRSHMRLIQLTSGSNTFVLRKSHTTLTASFTPCHTASTTARNFSERLYAVTNAATRPTIASTINPIGLAAITALRTP